jgi:hypothetical protein
MSKIKVFILPPNGGKWIGAASRRDERGPLSTSSDSALAIGLVSSAPSRQRVLGGLEPP